VALFRSLDGREMHTNVLLMTLQPDEGFDLSFQVKAPGERFTLHEQHMTFRYDEAFGKQRSRGYETLLLEIVRGDQTLFVHADEAEAAWRLYTPLLRRRRRLHSYPAGGPGPELP
jgi:glucose-6-phosphate 1-dehydrogenase